MHELHAEPGWRAVDLISDLHLSPSTPRSFDAWATYLRETSADAVLMLGDVFEVWVGDDALADAIGFEARCAEVTADAAQRRWLGFMAGNRDFLLGERACTAAGMHALPDPTLLIAFDQRTLLTHGDALCLDDHDYQRFRRMVRDDAWQRGFLARPLNQRRALAQQMRGASRDRQAQQAPAQWGDVDDAEALRWLREADAPTMIHGHTHRPAVHQLDVSHQRFVLSDWDLEAASPRADVIRLSSAGLQRLDLATAAGGVAATR